VSRTRFTRGNKRINRRGAQYGHPQWLRQEQTGLLHRGVGPALIDLIGGQVQVLFDNIPNKTGCQADAAVAVRSQPDFSEIEETAKLKSITQSRNEPASRVERVRILLAYWEDPAAPAALET
jgi:hypothetical protein